MLLSRTNYKTVQLLTGTFLRHAQESWHRLHRHPLGQDGDGLHRHTEGDHRPPHRHTQAHH